MTDQTCLSNSGKTHMYIWTSEKLVCPSRTRKKKPSPIQCHNAKNDGLLGCEPHLAHILHLKSN